MQDTIVALSTAAGAGAIAIVRMSGPDAVASARKVFRGPLLDRRLELGTLLDRNGCPIDRGMAVLMRAPRSYTREDVVELHCHGGSVAAREVIAACMAGGARPAQPGEFTRRAYENGRIDLSQAQAVMDMIAAGSAAAARASLVRMNGGLSRKVAGLEDGLLTVAAKIAAYLDYPDEDLEPVAAQDAKRELLPLAKELGEAIEQAPMSRRTLEGVRVAIAGAPNAGKSSLMNALLEHERAIVSGEPGTTRDTLTEQMNIHGVAMLLTDTAGLREGGGDVERIGIARARDAIAQADVLLLCVDASELLPDEALRYIADPRALLALNKNDLKARLSPADFAMYQGLGCVTISTVTGAGLEDLREALYEKAAVAAPGEALLTHESDVEAASRALAAVQRACGALDMLSLDCASLDLEDALGALRDITGSAQEALLDRVFSSFCLGK